MGSTAITYAAIALAIALVCLLGGFLWGRSNLQAGIELAVEREQASLDAREFAMRQQLEDAIAEIARLRPLAISSQAAGWMSTPRICLICSMCLAG